VIAVSVIQVLRCGHRAFQAQSRKSEPALSTASSATNATDQLRPIPVNQAQDVGVGTHAPGRYTTRSSPLAAQGALNRSKLLENATRRYRDLIEHSASGCG
jgi:hypothetical protein